MPEKTVPSHIEIATSAEALKFVRDLQKDFANKPQTPALRRRLRERLAKSSNEKLVGIAFRIFADLLRPPQEDPHRTTRTRAKPSGS
ncbi:hypothetical protein QTH97_33960 [Variovorax sp. J22R24]|uniref:hypothetical protein n=1 Tax=Variovorax gracilis TaxID=3053502 RepID=UPI0025772E77|nr:hypothetical protein [Variovorax sp. J22R24]MDM0109957.1 hypothetical protein [Variovorax sp. J22R24]